MNKDSDLLFWVILYIFHYYFKIKVAFLISLLI